MQNADSALSQLKILLNDELEQVKHLLIDMAKSQNIALIDKISHHIMRAGGKHIRPLLCLASANLFRKNSKNHIYLSTAIECIHTATLLHDDVIDESKTRRGLQTANHLWGDKASILVGDYLFSQAFKLMVRTDSLKALGILAHTSAIIAESEVWQLQEIANLNMPLASYLSLINAKTAKLFAAATEVGALTAGATASEISAIANYGEALGMCFQIVDDILDYTSLNADFGKKLGNDFYEGKVTAPLIFTIKNANRSTKELIGKLLNSRTPNDFSKIVEIIKEYNGIEEAVMLAKNYCQQGQKHLELLPASEIKTILHNLITFVVERDY